MANTVTSKFLLLIVPLAFFMVSMTKARPLDTPNKLSLMARLKLDEESSSCWDSLMQLQACSGELIMFFLNGETNLGPGCCQAIRIISHQCWPTMIGTLGFTTEETDVLQGYCDHHEPPHEPPVLEAAKLVDDQLPPMDLVP